MIHVACNLGRIQSALKLFDRLKEGIIKLYITSRYILDGLFQIKVFDGAYSFLIQHSWKDLKLDSSNYKYLIRVYSNSSQEKGAHNLMMEWKLRDFIDACWMKLP